VIRRPPSSTPLYSAAASDVYKRQGETTLETQGSLFVGPVPEGSCLMDGPIGRHRIGPCRCSPTPSAVVAQLGDRLLLSALDELALLLGSQHSCCGDGLGLGFGQTPVRHGLPG